MKPRRTLISDMLQVYDRVQRMHERLGLSEYTNEQMADALGKKPTHAEGTALWLMGWRKLATEREGRAVRLWLPPVTPSTNP